MPRSRTFYIPKSSADVFSSEIAASEQRRRMGRAKRKLEFDVGGGSAYKKVKVSYKKPKSFSRKVKEIVLKNTETKRRNTFTGVVGLRHNQGWQPPATSDVAAANTMANLLYCTKGDDSRSRDGDEIHVKKIDMKIRLEQRTREVSMNAAAGTLSEYQVRVIVWEADREEASDIAAPTNLFTPTTFFNQTNLVQAFLNVPKYRILKDKIYTIKPTYLADPGDLVNGQVVMATSKQINFTINLDKKYRYSTSDTRPDRQVGCMVIPWHSNVAGDGNDWNLDGQAWWLLHFKDI